MDANNSNELDFSRIPPYQPRRFVPDCADLNDADQVASLYSKLLARKITSATQLETLLMDRSELEAALDQQRAALYIRMTCQTNDSSRAKAYKKFIKTIPPAVKPLANQLDRKYLDLRQKFTLDEKRYQVYDRTVHADVELFREENVPIQTQEELLSQEYQTVCGTMTVTFQGLEYTMPQMHKFLQNTDRSLREDAWRAAADRQLQDAGRIDDIFDKMLSLRCQIAANANCDNYRDYKFREYHRFDYTTADCKRFHNAVEHLVIPLLRDICKDRRRQMNLSTLRPWDLNVDPKGQPPLKPFDQVKDCISGVMEMFHRIDPELSAQFNEVARLGLLDLANRKGKAPGGYQTTLSEARKPFIFMNAVGTNRDLFVLLHECGHAFHALAGAHDPLLAYRHAPIEFCEVASLAMELLGGPHLSVFYNEQDAKRSRRDQLEGIIQTLAWTATIDAFQHWLYENPNHTRHDRRDAWLQVHNRFDGQLIDWTDLQQQHAYLWHRQLHIFQFPLYYIEYAIAQLGALQLWVQAKQDPSAALANYRKALSLGGSRPLPQLFATAGLKFDFSEKTIAPLVNTVTNELAKLQD